jgi:hypothetical protein
MNNRRLTIFAFVAGAVLVGLLTAGPPTAMAQMTIDPHISICQSCPSGTDPNLITDTSSFQIGWDGNHTSLGPILIIVGTYNDAAAPTVTFGSNSYTPGTNGGTATPLYGWNGAQNVSFTAANGSNDAYSVLGISPNDGGSSEQFGNWTGGETANGITAATSFGLYVYEIPDVTLPASNTFISMDLEGATNGSYVLAYACEGSKDKPPVVANPCPSGNEGAVPFTTAGLVDQKAPEASAVTLTSLVLLAFGALVFRARRSQLT